MTKRDFEMKSDGVGIALFAFGVFSGVLVVQAMFQDPGAAASGPVEVLAALWVSSIGAFPSLVLNGAFAALGARMFLAGALPGLVRHVIGAAFLAVSLSVLLGAFGGDAGGTFGARTGGALSGATHVVLGAVFGAFAAIATVWFVWLRRDELPEEEPTLVRNPDQAVEARSEEDEGVSTEEAEALLPVHVLATPSVARAAPPPSPYPEDVRLKGEIPAGTRPLVSKEAIPQAFAPATYRWTAPGARREEENTSSVAAPVERDLDDADRYTLAEEEQIEPEARALDKNDVAAKLGALPRPAWEEGDEDGPVDAYGTPLELVKKLREETEVEEELSEPRPIVVERAEEEPVALAEQVAEVESAEDLSVQPRELEPEPLVARETMAEEPLFTAEPEPELDLAETERAALREEMRSLTFVTETDASADELELALDEPVAQEDELALAVRELEVEVETPAPVEVELEPMERSMPEGEAPVVIEPAVEIVPEPVAELPADPPPAPAAESVEPPAEPVVETPRKSAPRVQIPTLFDGPPEPESSVFATEPEPEPEPEPAPKRRQKSRPAEERELVTAAVADAAIEHDVVLMPTAVPAELTLKTPRGTLSGERAALLAEIGCLFIDRGRVAVSMLQRQYSMDFDDACKVLDDLQNLGLLGPYLGGQRRDILLTREAWLEKVGAS